MTSIHVLLLHSRRVGVMITSPDFKWTWVVKMLPTTRKALSFEVSCPDHIKPSVRFQPWTYWGLQEIDVGDIKPPSTSFQGGPGSPKKQFNFFWSWPKMVARPAPPRTAKREHCAWRPLIQNPYWVHLIFKVQNAMCVCVCARALPLNWPGFHSQSEIIHTTCN